MTHNEKQDVTQLLSAHREGDAAAMDELLGLVYPELKRIAQRQRGRADQTLDATSLVNELYLRLVRQQDRTINNRVHFFALASGAMRQIAIDYARRKSRAKRGDGVAPVPLDDRDAAVEEEVETLIALDQVMTKAAKKNPHLPQVVECRFFAGLSVAETADALGISQRSVERHWSTAKELLSRELG